MSTRKQRQRALITTFIATSALLALLVGLFGAGVSMAATLTSTIENTATGTGTGQVQYTGSDWTVCGGCGVDTGNNSFTYGYTVGSSFTIRFSGGQAKIWGVKESAGGIASVTVDGVAKGSIDNYAAAKTSTIIYDTGQIGAGTHTVTLTITGKNSQSSATVLSFDKADIYSADPTPIPTSTATPVPPTPTTPAGTQSLAINAGGAAAGSYAADAYANQGNQFSDTSTSIDTSGVTDPAPQAVYQNCRWFSSFTYTIPGLTAGASYTVRLHWAELTWQAVGQRKFNVAINGTTVLSAFDVYATAGYKHALVRSFTATANGSGQIVIAFTQGGADNPFISGIQIVGSQGGTPTPTPTATATPPPSGAPGLSGAGVENPYTFGTFRGTPVQVWETWNTLNSWAEMEGIPTVHTYFTGEGSAPFNARFPGKLSFSQPLWANGESAASCASGGDDTHYHNIAVALKNAGFPDAFIRLGWEQNGDWFWWHATSANASQWVQCFRHAYDAFKAVDSRFVIAWNPNKSTDMSGFDTRTTYPGDDKVDVIAVDFYDMFPNYPNQAAWDANYNTTENGGSPVGMGAYISYANSHNKPLAFPEWGLNTENSFDNPFYITQMANTFSSLRAAGKLYWESYFDLNGCTFEVTDGCNPNASAVYVQLF